jgi:hypothetical protein
MLSDMTTFLLGLSLTLGMIGTLLGVISLRFILELFLHLPDVQRQIVEEDDEPRLRTYRIWQLYRLTHPAR